MYPGSIHIGHEDDTSVPVEWMIPTALNLQDISIGGQGVVWHVSPVLRSLDKHTKLRRIHFHGGKGTKQGEITASVTKHAHSLRCLILEHILSDDSWHIESDGIAQAREGTHHFFRG